MRLSASLSGLEICILPYCENKLINASKNQQYKVISHFLTVSRF